jgi:RHS repeat-associated protein
VIQEAFPYGFEVKKEFDDFNRIVSLKMGSQGEVFYTYEHAYEEYDENGNLISERLIGNLGRITHGTDLRGQKSSIMSPYFSQECGYNPTGNLISKSTDRAEHRYSYDELSQLSSEGSATYAHDSLYNRTQKNGSVLTVNGLNELLSLENTKCCYDLNGTLALRQTPSETFQFVYDPLNRLVEATSEKQKIKFLYDPLGRCLSKTIFTKAAPGYRETSHEYYLYDGVNEIGAFTSLGMPTNLRVLGLTQCEDSPATVGVEIDGQIFAPIMDVQGNIRRLIDLDSKVITDRYDFTAFGEEQQVASTPINPWRFASKRFDQELGLIYFGRRHYDPLLGRWLTTDPAGFTDSVNLYQYVFNNPFRYSDPDGRFVMLVPLGALAWKVLAVAVVAAYVNYELEHQHRHSNSAFARAFNSAAHQVVQNLGGGSSIHDESAFYGEKEKH